MAYAAATHCKGCGEQLSPRNQHSNRRKRGTGYVLERTPWCKRCYTAHRRKVDAAYRARVKKGAGKVNKANREFNDVWTKHIRPSIEKYRCLAEQEMPLFE